MNSKTANKIKLSGNCIHACVWNIDIEELIELRDFLIDLGERAGVEFIIFDSHYAFDNMPEDDAEDIPIIHGRPVKKEDMD